MEGEEGDEWGCVVGETNDEERKTSMGVVDGIRVEDVFAKSRGVDQL